MRDNTTETKHPDWYTDPEDENFFRYYDGEAWTEHRSPRYVDRVDGVSEVESVETHTLFKDAVMAVRRLWCCYLSGVLVTSFASFVFMDGLWRSADLVLKGRLDEIVARVQDQDFDLSSQAEKDFFGALTFDWSANNFRFAAFGVGVLWLATIVVWSALTTISARYFCRSGSGHFAGAAILKRLLLRSLRLLGVHLQVGFCLILFGGLLFVPPVLTGLWPLLLISVPVFLVGLAVVQIVAPVAYTSAVVGPSRLSILYACSLIRQNFWTNVGKLALIALIVGFTANLGGLALPAISAVLVGFVSVVAIAFYTRLYLSFGGEANLPERKLDEWGHNSEK